MSIEDSWVFDSLVCFLHGPIWNAPLQTFIEEKSLIFDTNLHPDEDNPEVKKIYEEYKNLVDYMLGSFMDEIQISPEQFELACIEGRNQETEPFQFHQALFQQIWAANDLKMFIRMMTQRNVELQLQALDLIEKNQLAFLSDCEILVKDGPRNNEQQIGERSDDVREITKSVETEFESPGATAAAQDVADKFKRLNLFFEKHDEVEHKDVLSRQEYLRHQRDKIVERKKNTRAKQLQETMANKSGIAGARPSSAQVAQKLLENGGKAVELVEKNKGSDKVNSAVQLRRTLARRLRTEVVEK